ncbi:MAG: GntR family transcriptional regulator [Pseudotabrizicola sp.]|nr:GntR family transcriptional regulator [Pseudotabrizicola sp.]MDO8881605.1 GntR family transcriptional regulator [Pseudotabrizicola sp.]MDP2081549.1 GntR family transcriptional regulator [Pseudotabrizicola sp.]MDZ7575752.1 GntR family transcriptional regulator [Pseudotabrizicola sp.]
MAESTLLKLLEPVQRPSVTDTVFEELHRQILALDLPPGTKMSEVDVAKGMGVSRQPVRDAFYRLSTLGFLTIRPQRATVISAISEAAVMQARFIRSAIEAETVRMACERLRDDDLTALDDVLEQQRLAADARDPVAFHALDDLFHREICERSGHGFAWDIIRENKAHMDRVRFLSLSFASKDAYGDHLKVMAALRDRDALRAMAAMHAHLSRIKVQIRRIRAEHEAFFEGDPAPETLWPVTDI